MVVSPVALAPHHKVVALEKHLDSDGDGSEPLKAWVGAVGRQKAAAAAAFDRAWAAVLGATDHAAGHAAAAEAFARLDADNSSSG